MIINGWIPVEKDFCVILYESAWELDNPKQTASPKTLDT